MVATLLDAGALDPTVINGVSSMLIRSNARLGQGEWMVIGGRRDNGEQQLRPPFGCHNNDPEHMGCGGGGKGVLRNLMSRCKQRAVSKVPSSMTGP